VLNIARRWLYQTALFANADVKLPDPVSQRGYSRSRVPTEDSAQHVQTDYPAAAQMLEMYAECVRFVQQVLAALGMAQALFRPAALL
jgi:hypothetical protein